MKNDIFICYRGDSAQSLELGSRIYNRIHARTNYRVFFAPESISKGENFKTIVPRIMSSVTIVILLLDREFFNACRDEDDIVSFELKCAFNNDNVRFLPILLNHFTFKDVDLSELFSDEEVERIKHINAVDYNGIYDFSIEHNLIPIIDDLYNGGDKIESMSLRSKVRYRDANDKTEVEFLSLQQQMLYDYDREVLEKIMQDGENLVVLDVGCNNGSRTMRCFGEDPRVRQIVGIDRDSDCIACATENYPGAIFECVDVECDNFRMTLKQLCRQHDLEKFDLITISMLLLHLERPSKLLTALKSVLKPGGMIFIRDIDDGLNICFPDADNTFSTLTNICKYCDILGFRYSGREIYSYLVETGFRNVRIEKMGLDTSGMDSERKEALFDIYFGYIPTALEKTIERNPSLLRAQHDLEWVNQNMDKAYDDFMKNSFLFSLGYIIYTAQN